jgi:hypothetical protein
MSPQMSDEENVKDQLAYLDNNRPWSPDELTELSPEQRAELVAMNASVPVIEEVLEWFDSQIASFSDPTIITKVTVTTKAEDIKQAVLFAQKMIQSYKDKRNEFENRFKNFVTAVTPD